MTSLPDVIGFRCQRCGRCCKWGGPSLSATKNDIKRWRKEGRKDILKYVDFFYVKRCPKCGKGSSPDKRICDVCGTKLKRELVLTDLWFDPLTGDELQRCPFLRKIRNKEEYKCRIHETKPERCGTFPVIIQTECIKCGLNFVRYFKDTKLRHVPLKEYFKWTLDNFFIKVLKNEKKCPQCGEPIPNFSEWAVKNCPGLRSWMENRNFNLRM